MTVKAELIKNCAATESLLREVAVVLERLQARISQIAAASRSTPERRKKFSLFRCPDGNHLGGSDGRVCKHCGTVHL